jgi:hypothetical protein
MPLCLLIGCASENDLVEIPRELEVSPQLLDLGDVALGSELPFGILLEHTQGPVVTVESVTLGDDSGYFSLQGEFPLVVDNSEDPVALPGLFAPTALGWYLAEVLVRSDAENDVPNLVLRGHVVPATGRVLPEVLDFGVVEVGASALRRITVRNEGTVEITVSDIAFSNPAFELVEPPPFAIAAGTDLRLDVKFTAADAAPALGDATVSWANVEEVHTVGVRANACDIGVPQLYDLDSDGYTACSGDCDDTDATVHPGVDEVYDGVDQDCDATIDEGTEGYDDDGDGETELEGDCNDGDDRVFTGAAEVDNHRDDDCDGIVDREATDADGDGYGPEGGDCDDTDATAFPGATEVHDGVDQDCDDTIDEGTVGYDDDGDGKTELAGDCDDSDLTVFGGAPELPDWKDNDCDGSVDEGTVRGDDDGDGFTEVGGDCDDTDPNVSPAYGNCP